ncbi:IS3 family transposase [Mycoplasma sp. CSL7491-lung]|uniref:IS3 family transposase n=1 Tax=Mycoplasma sp. CSL7491-lung TaxID=549718 RepID=UPI001C11EB98|nr:IS3 family transposase [Mycoplasma sp. CSL7491-lung]MBU4693239.1 IS3 family transposase [Mycoplasma sp. CSL7491-lung]
MFVSNLPKSSFYEWKVKLNGENLEEKELLAKIQTIINDSNNNYGYRRVNLVFRNKGIKVNHKRALRIMREYNILCAKFHCRRKSYSSYKGNVGKIADDIINREFWANKPNEKWTSDVTEFHIPGCDKKL